MNEPRTQKELLAQLLITEKARLQIEKLSYASLRKLTELFDTAMKVNAGELGSDQILPSMVRINAKYQQRRAEVESEQAAEGIHP